MAVLVYPVCSAQNAHANSVPEFGFGFACLHSYLAPAPVRRLPQKYKEMCSELVPFYHTIEEEIDVVGLNELVEC